MTSLRAISAVALLPLLACAGRPRDRAPFPRLDPPPVSGTLLAPAEVPGGAAPAPLPAAAPPSGVGGIGSSQAAVPRVARVHADGRLELVGEGRALSPVLSRFFAKLRAARAGTLPPAMPPAEVAAWAELLGAIDLSLRGAAPPPKLDLLRAQVACEVELAAAEQRYGEVPAELRRAVRDLDARLSTAIERPPAHRPRRPAAQLAFPVEPAIVTSFFGPRVDPFDGLQRYHLGLDLQAEEGQVVLVAAPGVVLSAGWAGGHGNRVEVLHDSGVVTGYSHLSRIHVEPGGRVDPGQVVGEAGRTGRATGPHVHFEVWRDGEPEDPLDLLGEGGAVEVRAQGPEQ